MQGAEQKPWHEARYVVVDLEGNGRKPPDLVELGVVVLEGERAVSSQSWLVKPQQSIARHAIRVHGITNEDVKDAPEFAAIQEEVMAVFGNNYMIAHYAKVDYSVLARKLPDWQPRAVIDTWRLARKILPGLASYSLKNLITHLALEPSLAEPNSRLHRAEYDARATAQLFLHLVKHSPEKTLRVQDILNAAQLDIPPKQYRLL